MSSVVPRLAMFVVAAFLGCGSGSNRAVSASSSGAASSSSGDCEAGRCLDEIGEVIRAHRAEARACIDEARKRTPGLAGKLFIQFEIDPAGQVIGTSQGVQDGQLDDPAVVACVGEVVKRIKFAPSPAGKTTRGYHMFEFAPR